LVVPKYAPKNSRGGQLPIFKKIEKFPYLHHRLTDFDKIRHFDASAPSADDRPLKFAKFVNPRWWTAAILKKMKKIAISQQPFE